MSSSKANTWEGSDGACGSGPPRACNRATSSEAGATRRLLISARYLDARSAVFSNNFFIDKYHSRCERTLVGSDDHRSGGAFCRLMYMDRRRCLFNTFTSSARTLARINSVCQQNKAVEGAAPRLFRPMYATARGTRPVTLGLRLDVRLHVKDCGSPHLSSC